MNAITLPFAWATDTHLDHTGDWARDGFIEELRTCAESAILITGDISTAPRLFEDLKAITQPDKDIYFILGNHDFWKSSIEETDALARMIHRDPDHRLFYLPACGPIAVAPRHYLIGVNGYADGRAGNLAGSSIWLNDYRFCKNFNSVMTNDWRSRDYTRLQAILNRLGDESVAHVAEKLRVVPDDAERVYIATHAPPFDEAHWHDGKRGGMDWAPHFVNQVLGRKLRAVAEAHPTCEYVVLAGHTHGGVRVQLADNLWCFVGHADYGYPRLQRLVELPAVPVS